MLEFCNISESLLLGRTLDNAFLRERIFAYSEVTNCPIKNIAYILSTRLNREDATEIDSVMSLFNIDYVISESETHKEFMGTFNNIRSLFMITKNIGVQMIFDRKLSERDNLNILYSSSMATTFYVSEVTVSPNVEFNVKIKNVDCLPIVINEIIQDTSKDFINEAVREFKDIEVKSIDIHGKDSEVQIYANDYSYARMINSFINAGRDTLEIYTRWLKVMKGSSLTLKVTNKLEEVEKVLGNPDYNGLDFGVMHGNNCKYITIRNP